MWRTLHKADHVKECEQMATYLCGVWNAHLSDDKATSGDSALADDEQRARSAAAIDDDDSERMQSISIMFVREITLPFMRLQTAEPQVLVHKFC